jgi:eukaryotic-like serine/threonine-protein kinase
VREGGRADALSPFGEGPGWGDDSIAYVTAHVKLMGATLGGRYRIEGKLGEGGVAAVYDAIDVPIGRRVAIKALLGAHRAMFDVRQRLLREGYVGALLGHPHVCGVSDIGTLEDGSPFLVMDRLEGRTVANRLSETGPLSLATAVTITEQVLSALSAAHARGIVHRDIKADNVFLAKVNGLPPLAKLLDFGTALCPSELLPTRFDERPLESQLTAAGMVVGTPAYMSPEQAHGRRDLDARVDLYQVGVFFYEIVSGIRPFAGETFAELLRNITTGAMQPLEERVPRLPGNVAAVVRRALATSREARFQNAEEMLEAFQSTRFRATVPDAWEHTTRIDPAPSRPEPSGTHPMLPRDRIR